MGIQPLQTGMAFFKDLGIIMQLLSTRGRDAPKFYEALLSRSLLLGDKSMYLNLGYWPETDDYDIAAQNMAKLMADTVGLSPADKVVDVGFGFGDQDIFWAKQYGSKIVGFNITESQVETARNRVEAAGLEEKVDLRVGSATEIPLTDGSVDVVFALETAFHFDTREKFFEEAFRILRPGGRIVLADFCPNVIQKEWWGRIMDRFNYTFLQIPMVNVYYFETYVQKLSNVGFGNIKDIDITDDVWPGFSRHAEKLFADPEWRGRAHPLAKNHWYAMANASRMERFSSKYFILSAIKPL